MSFGPHTVTFEALLDSGTVDALGSPVLTPSLVDVHGCLHEPLNASETPEWVSDIGTQVWDTTAPPQAASIAAKSTGKLVVDGATYQIVGGAQPVSDFSGLHFVRILSKLVED